MERLIHEFRAWETDGTEHTVQVIQGYHQESGPLDGGDLEPNRLKELRTTRGEMVANPEPGVLGIKRRHEFIPLDTDDPMAW